MQNFELNKKSLEQYKMVVSDAVYYSICGMLDEIINYFDEEEYLTVADDDEIMEIVAVKLKFIAKSNYLRMDPDREKLNDVDWMQKAREFTIEYITNTFINDSEDE